MKNQNAHIRTKPVKKNQKENSALKKETFKKTQNGTVEESVEEQVP